MKFKILISAPYMQSAIERFRNIFEERDIDLIIPVVNERLEEKELLDLINDIDGVISGDDKFTEKVLRSAKKLKVISKWGTGIDSIDTATCRKLGIRVCNTPNAFSEPVADSVMGYILCFARNIHSMDRNMRKGNWEKIPCRSLRECTLGVIGVGNVGKAVVRRAVAFRIRILGNDIIEIPQKFIEETGIEMVTKRVLVSHSDFISLNCDLNPSSYHMIDDYMFSYCNHNAYIINTARGPIIDNQSLIKALQDKVIAGAALDVYEEEPLPLESPLLEMENVLLSPHNANSSPEAWEKVHLNTINNLLDALEPSL